MTVSKDSDSSYRGSYAFYDENFKPMFKRGISRKIGESAFVQQTLPTHRLSWSPLKICPVLLLMGALFIGMGVGIKKFANGIQEVKVSYTNCTSIEHPGETCYKLLEGAYTNSSENGTHGIFLVDANDIEDCSCNVNFELTEPLKKTVYIYYSLINFYQNHLKCYQSRDENQLKGNLFHKEKDKNGFPKPKDPSSACKDMDFLTDKMTGRKRIYYPCGVMANSMFNDEIELIYHQPPEQLRFNMNNVSYPGHEDGKTEEVYRNENDLPQQLSLSSPVKVPLIRTGIAWDSDRKEKYAYPDEFFNSHGEVWANYVKPMGWKKPLWQLDNSNMSNNGVLNEDFIVWMRASAFPWFRKLHRIVNSQSPPFDKGLPAGNYTFAIKYNYDVSSFNGEKELILTTSKMVGGKNMFLAIVYMATGSLCIFLSIVLFALYKFCGEGRAAKLKSQADATMINSKPLKKID